MQTAPPTPTSCTESMADRTRLHRETERLRRMPRVRDWLRADALVDQIGTVCDLAGRSCASCQGEVALRARSLGHACQEATRPVWTAIGLDQDIREGRRELRRLSIDEQHRDYEFLLGRYEYQQQEALRQHAPMLQRLETQVAALETARSQAPSADRLQTELAATGLQLVLGRLRELSALVDATLNPPPPPPRARARR
ncbi:MAG: hypothetical protein IPH72_30940 [Sandaracinaceae bacterium]|nr:hypothetical protein [Sandaracinaceae bacterium]